MERLKNSSVLVTGGTGFIGSHLVKKLIKLSAKVSVIDISIDKKSFFVTEGLQKSSKFFLIDIRNKEKVFSLFEKQKFEYVFHFAAEPIVENVFENPYSAFETNIMGTVNALESARMLKNTKAIVIASSDKAYGKTQKAYTENSPLKGDHPYDVSKSAADLIAQTYFKSYGLPVIVTRFGNVYGEGDTHLNRIVPGICEALIRKKTLMLRSNGKYVRDYVYVDDIVNGCIELLMQVSKTKGEAFNFSSSDNFSVTGLIEHVERILKVKIPYKILDITKNEIPYQHLNDNKIRKLGWKNNYNLETTFNDILDWYKKLL